MYDMLTGSPPFTAENRKKTIEKILKVSFLSISLFIPLGIFLLKFISSISLFQSDVLLFRYRVS